MCYIIASFHWFYSLFCSHHEAVFCWWRVCVCVCVCVRVCVCVYLTPVNLIVYSFGGISAFSGFILVFLAWRVFLAMKKGRSAFLACLFLKRELAWSRVRVQSFSATNSIQFAMGRNEGRITLLGTSVSRSLQYESEARTSVAKSMNLYGS